MTLLTRFVCPVLTWSLIGMAASVSATNIEVVEQAQAAQSGKQSRLVIADKGQARAVYLVELGDPSVLEFNSTSQLGAQAKAMNFEPTAPDAVGNVKFDAQTAAVKRYRGYLANRQQSVLSDFEKRLGRAVVPIHRYGLVANGFAIQLDAGEAQRLSDHPEVRSLRPEGHYSPLTDFSARFVGADSVWSGTVPGSTLQTRGEGVVVGIIDSGINFSHPAFADPSPDGYNHNNPRPVRYGLCNNAGETRCNDKLIGVYDYINEAGATGAAAGTDLTGHGTHVAATAIGNPASGSVAAQIVNYNVATTGVAPRANVIVYKVCRNVEMNGCSYSAAIAALDQAVLDGVDVINFSIGGDAFSPWQDARAFLGLRAAGGLSSVAAGNSGPTLGRVGSPSNAPWVVSVANALSNKSFQTTLANVNGTGVTTPFSLIGQGTSGGVGESQVVYAGDFGDPNCVGSYPGGTFANRIVICDQGRSDALFQKAQRVGSAGAVGLVVANRQRDGNNTAPTMISLIPTVHIGYQDGELLKTAVRNARIANGQIRARIDGMNINGSGRGSILAESSSKGPVTPFPGYLKPNVAAPGTNIAAAYIPGPTNFDALTGTSMAGPHVAGAAALIAAAQPTWTPAQIESALLTSVTDNMLLEDGLTRARYFEAGAGMLNIPAALKAGLHFNTTQAEFLAANPQTGGNPETLNQPYLHSSSCFGSCTFTRRVTANVGGAWTLSASMPAGVGVSFSPGAIALAAGESATVTVTLTVNQPGALGRWQEGTLRFSNTTSPTTVSNTVVPISVFASGGTLPAQIRVTDASVSGGGQISLPGLIGFDEVAIGETELKRLDATSPAIAIDPTPDDRYDNVNVNFTRLIARPTVPAGTSAESVIYVEVVPAAGQDTDLFVGFDLDGDEVPDENEQLCASFNDVGVRDSCFVRADFASAGDQYWVMVQNYSAPANAPPAQIHVYTAALSTGSSDLGFTAQASLGKTTAGQSLPIQLNWNMPHVGVGEKAVSVLKLGSDRAFPTNVGLIPVVFERGSSTTLPPIVMNARQDVEVLSLQPGQAHERIVVDVPPNQTALILRAEGTGGDVDLYVSRHTGPLSAPTFAAAPPRLQQPFTSIHPGNTEVVALEGTQLTAGRYYLTPVNVGTSVAKVTLSVFGEFSGSTVQPQANGYFNPARSGHGVFLARTPQVWALAWYTFDNAGKPLWYTAQGAAAAASDGIWTAPIYRSTWNGQRDLPQLVGEVILTFDGTGSFTYSWMLDGQYGSEPFLPIGAPLCANGNLSVGGGWLRPDQLGWGSYFLNFAGNFEAEAIYVYDTAGLPRWVIGDGTYATTLQKNLFQVNGFCPTCALVTTTRTQVGSASRTLASANSGTFSSNFTFADGLSGNWVQSGVNWVKLTPDLACP